MSIQVTVGTESVDIDREVFLALLDNSVVYGRQDFRKAVTTGTISFGKLVALTRKAEIPYPLLFAPRAVVEAQLQAKTKKLLTGVGKEQFSMNARGTVELRDVELIVKDLLHKQALYKKHLPALPDNALVGAVNRTRTPAHDAATIFGILVLSGEELRAQTTKEAAVALLVERLEAIHVLVARSVRGYMPQLLDGLDLSGMTVRDRKAPYIFLAGGSHGEDEEPYGRQLFTLALLSVLIGRKKFRAVTMDATALLQAPPSEYSVVGEMLMPERLVRSLDLSSVDAVRSASDGLKVTPSALVVRAQNLQLLTWDAAGKLLSELGDAFRARPRQPARQPKPINAVRKYNGRGFTRTMLAAVDRGEMSPGEFCRVVGARKIHPEDLDALRRSVL